MLHYDIIDLRAVIDPTKSNNSKECMVCHYWYYNHRFKFRNSVFNGCHDLTMLCVKISDITISNVFIVVLFMTLANLKQFIC